MRSNLSERIKAIMKSRIKQNHCSFEIREEEKVFHFIYKGTFPVKVI